MLERPRRTRLTAAVTAQLAVLLALASGAGACPVISPAAVGAALHMPEVAENSLLFSPGPSWSVIGGCSFVAWSGKRPLTSSQVEAGFAAGTFATVSIATWAPAPGLFFAGAQLAGFKTTLAQVREEGRAQVVKALHGEFFTPRALGAHPVGWKARTPSYRVARGVWWSKRTLRIIEIGVREGRRDPAADRLNRVASTAVKAFGL